MLNNSSSEPAVSGNGPVIIEALDYRPSILILIMISYIVLHISSTWVVNYTFEYAGVEVEDEQKDTGTAIGKIENVLVLTLMLLEAYTALGVIFAAKSIVRAEDLDTGDTSYYLTGTIANFTYSVVIGVLLHISIRFIVTLNLLSSVPI